MIDEQIALLCLLWEKSKSKWPNGVRLLAKPFDQLRIHGAADAQSYEYSLMRDSHIRHLV